MARAPFNYLYGGKQEYDKEAARSFTARFEPPDDPTYVVFKGNCPRCKEPLLEHWEPLYEFPGIQKMTADEVRDVAAALPPRIRETPLDRDFTIICNCPTQHPKTPPGKTGCGAYWVLHVQAPGGMK